MKPETKQTIKALAITALAAAMPLAICTIYYAQGLILYKILSIIATLAN